MENEVDKLLGNLPTQDSLLEEVAEKPTEAEEEESVESVKNRRHRRLEAQLQAERESNIALNERVKVLSETQRVSKDAELDPRLIEAFGTSDEGKRAAQIFASLLEEKTTQAREQALEDWETKQSKDVQEQQQYESQIDSELEALEDEHGIDLTSDSPKARKTRREFLELVQELSPKDSEGNVADYADFGSVFSVYRKTQETAPSRSKELADRSMVRSSGNTPTEAPKGPITWGVARSAIGKILNP